MKASIYIFILSFLLIATLAWSASLTLNWTDNSNNEDGFKVERRLGATGTFAQVGSTGVGVTTFADILPDTQRYCYRVQAFNTLGNSGYTNIACGVAILPTVPADPSGLTVTITITITPTPN